MVASDARTGELLGVVQYGPWESDQVIWKLYVRPDLRSNGLGPQLLDAVTAAVPAATQQVFIEHFAVNERAAAFYEREGFGIDRTEQHPSGDERLAVVWRSRAHDRPA